MDTLTNNLFEYGILGLWVAYMIYRDIKTNQRIRDIKIQPYTGKLFFLSDDGSLWKMEKNN